jgi:hypothetical protein
LAGVLIAQVNGQGICLGSTIVIELDITPALDAPFNIPRGLAMTNDQDFCGAHDFWCAS